MNRSPGHKEVEALVPRTHHFWLVLPAFFAAASPAFAHKLKIDCRITGQRVHVEAFYDDNTPAQQATVVIKNEKNENVITGKTDERGVWICIKPPPGAYRVRAETAGHVAEEPLSVAVPSGPASTGPTPDKGTTREEETVTPWRGIVFGCAAIAVLFTMLWLARRQSTQVG